MCHLADTINSYLRNQSPWKRKTGVYRKFPYHNEGMMAQLSNAFLCTRSVRPMSLSPSGSVNSVVLSWEQIDNMTGLHGFVLEFSPVAVWEDEMFERSPRHAMMAEVPKWLDGLFHIEVKQLSLSLCTHTGISFIVHNWFYYWRKYYKPYLHVKTILFVILF